MRRSSFFRPQSRPAAQSRDILSPSRCAGWAERSMAKRKKLGQADPPSPHDLRRTFAARRLSAWVPPKKTVMRVSITPGMRSGPSTMINMSVQQRSGRHWVLGQTRFAVPLSPPRSPHEQSSGRFLEGPHSWPRDSRSHVFLARAVNLIGTAKFREAWTGSEGTTELYQALPVAPMAAGGSEFFAHNLLMRHRPDFNRMPLNWHRTPFGTIPPTVQFTAEEWAAAHELVAQTTHSTDQP